MKFILSAAALAITLAWAPAARSAPVIVFDNASYVDTLGGSFSESDAIQASLTSLGHSVSTFIATDAAGITAALAGQSVMVLPEQEMGDLGDALDTNARQAVRDFVSAGGGLIVSSDYRSTINEIFGFSLNYFLIDSSSSLTAAAAGTAFAGGPASLPSPSATLGFVTATLPTGGKAIYDAGGIASVALLEFGAGKIVTLAWDWFNAAPLGTQDGGWLSVLDRAVLEVTPESTVPEPASLALVAGALLMLRLRRKRGSEQV